MPADNSNAMSLMLERISLMYDNMLKFSEICALAISSNESIITTTVTNEDGSTTELQFPSFAYIQEQLSVFERNLNALTGAGNGKQLFMKLVEKSDEIRTLIYQSLLNQPEAIPTLVGTLAQDNNVVELGNKLLDHTTTLGICAQIDVTGKVSSQMRECQITKFICTDTLFEALQQYLSTSGKFELSYAEVQQYLLQRNYKAGTDYEIEDFTQELRARRAMSSGTFVALSSRINSDGSVSARFDTLQYDSVNAAVKGSLTLAVDDVVSTPSGDLLMRIDKIDPISKTVVMRRHAGSRNIANAFDNKWVYVDPIVKKVVDVPIKHSEKFVLFLSPVHEVYGVIADYSPAILIDVTTLTIRDANNNLQNANAYMLAHGDSAIGAYLSAITTDMYPPSKYGIKPDKPAMTADACKVVQINSHLIDNVDKQRILKLYEQKRSLQQEISKLDSSISDLSTQLNTRNYSNNSEKAALNEQYLKESRSRQEKAETLKNIIDSMLDVNSASYDALYNPKFRIRGFIPVQQPMVSRYTSPQHIIQFKVQYRYVSLSNVVAKADTFDVAQVGTDETMTATFSTWNEVFTPLRRKHQTEDGYAEWEQINESSIDAICCNQLDIPISANEIVQIRIKAISECGYPNVLTESDWSSIITVQFPESLAADAQFVSLKDELYIDKQNLSLENMLINKGILKHVETSATENNGAYYAHSLMAIDSGFLTPELARISAYDKFLELSNLVTRLEDIVVNKGSMLRLMVIDENYTEIEVVNGASIALYAGAYTDSVDITDAANYGKVMTRTYWLKYENIGDSTINVYSMFKGEGDKKITELQAPQYINAPWSPLTYQEGLATKPAPHGSRQFCNQILYLGNRRANGVDALYAQRSQAAPTQIATDDIDTTAPEENKIWVQPKNASDMSQGFDLVAIKTSVSADKYSLVHKSSPAYAAYVDIADTEQLAQLFANIANLDGTEKSALQVGVYTEDAAPKILYDAADVYTAGANTRGAALVLTPSTNYMMQINGSTSEAALAVLPGSQNALMIPITFQARMTDIIGNIDGTAAIGTAQFRYTKIINIHTYIAGKEFSFDIKVYADFRPTTALIGSSIVY